MILFPNAKINLGLRVISRRPDGYHNLDTVMVPTGWRDILEIVPGHGTGHNLTVTGRTVDCPPEKNLVMKALLALETEIGHTLPATDIFLHKIIPDGAGLGGGSADAAFTLKGLDEVFGLGLGNERLADVAARVGADCPFFIYNCAARCTGTGTDISPAKLPAETAGLTLLIAKPRVAAVSTAAAYAGITPHECDIPVTDIVALPPQEWRGQLVNDFETTVFKALPEVAAVKETMYSAGAVYASMSGSGAAVYGLFDAKSEAETIASALIGCDTYIGHFGRF